jgi:hypothetical protein
MLKYEEIFKNHNGAIAHKSVHYFYIYDLLFEKYISMGKPVSFMETGVDRGGSLEIWKKHLPVWNLTSFWMMVLTLMMM